MKDIAKIMPEVRNKHSYIKLREKKPMTTHAESITLLQEINESLY